MEQKDYTYVILRTKTLDNRITTVSMTPIQFVQAMRKFGKREPLRLAVLAASHQYDRTAAPGTRSKYVCKTIFSSN